MGFLIPPNPLGNTSHPAALELHLGVAGASITGKILPGHGLPDESGERDSKEGPEGEAEFRRAEL